MPMHRRPILAPGRGWFRLADLALRIADAIAARRERRKTQ